MNTRYLLLLAACVCRVSPLWASPPAPDHTFFGLVRNDHGTPVAAGDGTIILNSTAGEIARGPVDSSLGSGINYMLRVPMDAGALAGLYKPTALKPTMPFTIQVVINGVSFLPIEIAGRTWTVGQPGKRTRLDLTLGVDSDGDGLPDAWERDLIDKDPNDALRNLSDVKPGDDGDGDGLTNAEEYRAGTYALDRLDGLSIEVVNVVDGVAQLRFLAVTGRTYRVRSSLDAGTWQEQPFSLLPNGTATAATYRAEDVRTLDVYFPWSDARRGFFQLFAE